MAQVETLDPKVIEMAQRLLEKQEKAHEKTRENLVTKYQHARPDTLELDPVARKYSVEIECVGCGKARRVYTSDLFQVKHCMECAKEAKAESRKVKQAELAAALKLIREGRVQ